MENSASMVAGVLRTLTREQYVALRAEDLLDRFVRQRDEDAFRVLVERFGGLVLRRCRAVLGRDDLAQEAFQETFLALARKGQRIREGVALVRWLERTAHRHALGVQRGERRRLRREQRASVAAMHAAAPSANTLAERAEAASEVRRALAALPDHYRLPLELVYLDNHSHGEAAVTLAWPKGTVDSNVKRGLQQLKAVMGRAGYPAVALSVEALLAQSAQAIPLGWAAATAQAALRLPGKKGLLAAVVAGAVAAVATRRGAVATLVLAGVLAGAAYAIWELTEPNPTADNNVVAGPEKRPPAPLAPAESLQAKNLRVLRDELVPELLAALKPLALGDGDVVLTNLHAHDVRVRCEFELRHQAVDIKTRLLFIYDMQHRRLDQHSDLFGDGKWTFIDPEKQLVLARLFGKEYTLQLEPLKAAFAVMEKMPPDARGAEEWARHKEAVRKACEPYLGKWLVKGKRRQVRQIAFSPEEGLLLLDGTGQRVMSPISFAAFWDQPDGSLLIPPRSTVVYEGRLKLMDDGRRLVFENSGDWWRRP
jgi:RNA polymerase sigma factor (sigma-70 family)